MTPKAKPSRTSSKRIRPINKTLKQLDKWIDQYNGTSDEGSRELVEILKSGFEGVEKERKELARRINDIDKWLIDATKSRSRGFLGHPFGGGSSPLPKYYPKEVRPPSGGDYWGDPLAAKVESAIREYQSPRIEEHLSEHLEKVVSMATHEEVYDYARSVAKEIEGNGKQWMYETFGMPRTVLVDMKIVKDTTKGLDRCIKYLIHIKAIEKSKRYGTAGRVYYLLTGYYNNETFDIASIVENHFIGAWNEARILKE